MEGSEVEVLRTYDFVKNPLHLLNMEGYRDDDVNYEERTRILVDACMVMMSAEQMQAVRFWEIFYNPVYPKPACSAQPQDWIQ